MGTDETLAAVRGDLWSYADEYACSLCGKVSLDGRPHLACLTALRSEVCGLLTVGDVGRVLGVTGQERAV